jgi:hypothetical protein
VAIGHDSNRTFELCLCLILRVLLHLHIGVLRMECVYLLAHARAHIWSWLTKASAQCGANSFHPSHSVECLDSRTRRDGRGKGRKRFLVKVIMGHDGC